MFRRTVVEALTRWLRWLEQHPVRLKAAGSVSGWGAYRRQPIDVSVSHQSLSLSLSPCLPLSLLSEINFLIIFREGRKGDRERESNINVQLLGVMACNPCMYPDWESNLRCFGSQPVLNPLSYTSQGLKSIKKKRG
ncbi:hypothetical protein HJG60_011411 [Phyllostomus discolor]|uniref:Uncharacterized protein n=1 Tax=Phyllostomus discolor TaxID=89673 RepID=A0A834E5K2_9CHIR|nr:hypothetical protein HJG60_011411 [Phyllostomus discolor]